MTHATRATLCAALLGLALFGPAGPSRLVADVQAWLAALWADAGGIMNPNGLEEDAGSIMDPNG